jgi:chloramphenicol-sensitive protein RarD
MQNGILYAAVAYAIWGVFPLYFKTLIEIPPDQILAHRMVWSLVFLGIVLTSRGQWAWLRQALRQPKVLAGFTASALLLSCNWFLYIWAVNNGHIVESSLGYFITPLVNVAMGFIVLRERLRPGQWTAIALAACGVAWLTFHNGSFPWIAIVLALTFGTYGLLRKTAALGALEGLTLETLVLFPFAFIYLMTLTAQGTNAFMGASTTSQILLAAAGPITAIPLLLFAAGARRISLAVLGILQYIGPTLQFLIGVFLYDEAFGGSRLVGFALIWGALLVFSLEGAWKTLAQARAKRLA